MMMDYSYDGSMMGLMGACGDSWMRPAMGLKTAKTPCCQVPGCTADLTAEPKAYCLRKRICTRHMQADVLQYPGNQWCRYCFQCAKVEPLSLFDGNKKSCRRALHRRRVRPAASNNTAPAAVNSNMTAMTAAATSNNTTAMTDAAMPQHLLQVYQQQQAQLLQLQQQEAQLLQQQQQQQAMAGGDAFQQQLSTAAQTLQLVRNMAEQMAGALARTQAASAMAASGPAAFQGPAGFMHCNLAGQQQVFAGDCNSRTPSPTIDEAFGPAVSAAAMGPMAAPSAVPASAAAAAASAAAAAATSSAAAHNEARVAVPDDAFDNFLETLLAYENEDDTAPSTSSTSTVPDESGCSASATPSSATPEPEALHGHASLAPVFPPFSAGQPGTAAMCMAPSSLALPAHTAAAGSCMMPSAGPQLLPMPSSSMPTPFAGHQPCMMAPGGAMGMPNPAAAARPGSAGPFAGAPAFPDMAGMAAGGLQAQASSTLGPAACDVQRKTTEQLQALTAMLQQVQSTVLALAQNIQVA